MHELARVVRELIVASDSYRRTMAGGIDLSTTEAAVLGHLLHDGPQTPSVIAARAGLTPAAGTSLLDRLARYGLVERRPHPRDRRSLLVHLTRRGHAAITAMSAMFSEDLLQALERSDPRLVEDPELRRAVTHLVGAMAASLRARAGDAAGVRAAILGEMSASHETADGEHGR
ncbi:MarR family transcriptional regulator [Actinomycetospora chibensis]|uniref:MarR family transcriptional regulator n=1 Tax=Actinomycetospora chibensis TaxID=663606 RepID=A0ABV9RS35_9PSEU|nr:MarR family transcriptional regulator [Actinomycetospora chibensis]MDD7922212.1 MarR family transcriptional regulator [Actinomycetospora chibensis]